jgi:hypothetical protein
MLIEGDVGVPNSGLEADLGRLEWVVGWENEEKLKLPTLSLVSTASKEACCGFANLIWRAFWPIHYNTPVVNISLINEADLHAFWCISKNFCQLLGTSLVNVRFCQITTKEAHLGYSLLRTCHIGWVQWCLLGGSKSGIRVVTVVRLAGCRESSAQDLAIQRISR